MLDSAARFPLGPASEFLGSRESGPAQVAQAAAREAHAARSWSLNGLPNQNWLWPLPMSRITSTGPRPSPKSSLSLPATVACPPVTLLYWSAIAPRLLRASAAVGFAMAAPPVHAPPRY